MVSRFEFQNPGKGKRFLAYWALILPKDAEAAWLEPALTDAAAAIEFAREFAGS